MAEARMIHKCRECPFMGEVPNATDDAWTCPKCGRDYQMQRPSEPVAVADDIPALVAELEAKADRLMALAELVSNMRKPESDNNFGREASRYRRAAAAIARLASDNEVKDRAGAYQAVELRKAYEEVARLTSALAERDAEIAKLKARPEYDQIMRAMRDVNEEDVCQRCHGTGAILYPSTSVWAGGAGGMTPTRAACDRCWGSGEASRPWMSHRGAIALVRERDEALKDAAFHADCRPNRRQAEAAYADNKALNDRLADVIRERDEARAAMAALLRGLSHLPDGA